MKVFQLNSQLFSVLRQTEGTVEKGFDFLTGFVVKNSGTNHSTALMKGRGFETQDKNLLPVTRQAESSLT